MVLGVSRFLGCYETGPRAAQVCEKERLLGDWTPGRFAWEFEVVKSLQAEPIPARGMQGLWEWEPPQWLAEELAY